MLKSIWNSIRPPREDDGREVFIARDKLQMLIEHFPIGKKLRYSPEYQRDIVFDTIVVAYSVNDQYLYSRDAVRFDAEGQLSAFAIGGNRPAIPASRLKRFFLVVPDTSDMERSLDYYRRASIGRAGQFAHGNAISLIAESGERGVPTVDTQVEKRLVMTDGPYADHQMVLLDPELDTLSVTDQRRKPRLQTDVPVDLYLHEGASPFRCVLGDFSDLNVRLRPAPGEPPMPAMDPNDVVTIVIDLGEVAKTYLLRGTVFRRDEAGCVLRLERLYRNGDFAVLKLMDTIEIRAGLLNYGC